MTRNTQVEKRSQGRPKIQSKLVALFNRAMLPLFVIALMLAAFAGGVYVTTKKVFPYDLLRSAYKTSRTLFAVYVEGIPVFRHLRFVNISPDSVEVRRFEFIGADTLADPILVVGGADRFIEYCPNASGCLAVEYDGRGEVRHAYPYRPDEFENVPISVDFPYELVPGFQFRYSEPFGISRYSNGDLLVVFNFYHSFPFGGGVARVNRDGHVIWYRRDYSHHVPYITDGDTALVPSLRIGEGPIVFKSKSGGTHRLIWRKNQKYCNDFVHIIDGKGRLLKAISVLDALLESPYAPSVYYSDVNFFRTFDPLHLNFVHKLREDAGGAKGIAPGDLVVSLRNLSAFGILDRKSHRLKKLVRGGFFRQHSVSHLEGSKFLMFDNFGGDGVHGPSRLLMVDLADGKETTIFPNDRTPEHLRDLFSYTGGHISISPDRRRCIVTYKAPKSAVEVRLADGAVLAVFTNLHDMSHLTTLPDERKTKAVRLFLNGIKYIDSNGVSR